MTGLMETMRTFRRTVREEGAWLMVGQAPGPKTSPRYPLFPFPPSSAGGKLQKLTGLSMEDYFKKYERTNLLRDHPGAAPGEATAGPWRRLVPPPAP